MLSYNLANFLFSFISIFVNKLSWLPTSCWLFRVDMQQIGLNRIYTGSQVL